MVTISGKLSARRLEHFAARGNTRAARKYEPGNHHNCSGTRWRERQEANFPPFRHASEGWHRWQSEIATSGKIGGTRCFLPRHAELVSASIGHHARIMPEQKQRLHCALLSCTARAVKWTLNQVQGDDDFWICCRLSA